MDLIEFKQRVRSNTAVSQVEADVCCAGEVDLEVDVEEVEDSELDADDINTALALLDDSMRMLGFMGNINVSGTIVKKDRERMEKLAEEIKAFLSTISFGDEEDEEEAE